MMALGINIWHYKQMRLNKEKNTTKRKKVHLNTDLSPNAKLNLIWITNMNIQLKELIQFTKGLDSTLVGIP